MAGRLLELAIAIKGKIDESLPSAAREANENIDRLNDRLKQLQKVDGMVSAWKSAAQHVRSYKNELSQAQQAASQASNNLKNTTNVTHSLAASYSKAQQKAKQMGGALRESRTLLVGLDSELRAAGFATDDFAASETKLKSQIEAVNKAIENQKKVKALAMNRQAAQGNVIGG